MAIRVTALPVYTLPADRLIFVQYRRRSQDRANSGRFALIVQASYSR